MKQAVIYARYSCDKQHETSIEGQLDVCYKYATSHGLEVVHEYIDRATTGRSDKRDQFQQMLFDSNKKLFDAVIVYKLDRFSRNRYESVINEKHLNDNGVQLLSAMENVNDNAESVILKSLMIGLSEYYSIELSQKVLRTFRVMRENGMWLGGKRPYGFNIVEKKYVINDDEARNLRALFLGVANGTPPARLGVQLNIPVDAHRLIKNPMYKGCLSHKGEILPDVIPRIIDDKTWELANSFLKNYEHHAHYSYALSGKMFCGSCGTLFKGESSANRHGTTYRYYKPKCSCTHNRIRCDYIENKIVETIQNTLDKETVEKIAQRTLELIKQNLDQHSLDAVNKELQANKRKQQNIVNAITDNGYNELLGERLKELSKEEQVLLNRLTALQSQSVSKDKIMDYVQKFLNSDNVANSILRDFVTRVEVYDDYIDVICGTCPRPPVEKGSSAKPMGVPIAVVDELFVFTDFIKFRIAC